jgi:hypothetical protein
MAKLFPWIFIVLLFAACYRNAPEPPYDTSLVASPDSMVSILTDIHLLEGIANTIHLKDTAMDSLARANFDYVLAKHKTDRKAFEESIHYYAYHAEEFSSIYDRVIINLSKKESELVVPSDTLKD